MQLDTLSIEQLADLRDKVIATLKRDRPPRRCRIVRTPKTIHSAS